MQRVILRLCLTPTRSSNEIISRPIAFAMPKRPVSVLPHGAQPIRNEREKANAQHVKKILSYIARVRADGVEKTAS